MCLCNGSSFSQIIRFLHKFRIEIPRIQILLLWFLPESYQCWALKMYKNFKNSVEFDLPSFVNNSLSVTPSWKMVQTNFEDPKILYRKRFNSFSHRMNRFEDIRTQISSVLCLFFCGNWPVCFIDTMQLASFQRQPTDTWGVEISSRTHSVVYK